jgi:hypothetical protein
MDGFIIFFNSGLVDLDDMQRYAGQLARIVVGAEANRREERR